MVEPYLALQTVMMPRDTNPHGTIFGGVILSHLDMAAWTGARHEVIKAGGTPPILVTVALNKVVFREPVCVGDVVKFKTSLGRFGRTSMTIQVVVEAERGDEVIRVTEAEVVLVGIDPHSPDRKPVPLLPDGRGPHTNN
jgi:acyl-CoA thioesterase YciA